MPRAIAFFSHDLNPHYFLNPPAYSYLLHIVFELWFGSADAVMRAYASDPTSVFVIARVVAAVLGTLAVWLTYLAGGRFFNRTVGLLAAAIFGFAFLPIFYSHLALNDVPTLAPVALSLFGIAGVFRRGRTRDYAIAGIGIGLASATKYTGGITLVCLLGAFVSRRRRPVVLGLDAQARARARAGARRRSCSRTRTRCSISRRSRPACPSRRRWPPARIRPSWARAGSGITYYLWTFTWGLGWGPTLAAIGGAVLLLARRRLAMALVLLPAPIAFIIFMGDQQRFFGRWLMPIFPIVAILAAYGAVELVRWLARTIRLPVVIGGAAAAVLLLGQSVAADIHNDRVLSRPDTRNLTRAWMVRNIPAGSKVVIEPVVPDNWASDIGSSNPATPTGDRWYRFATWLTDLGPNGATAPGRRPPLRRRRPVRTDAAARSCSTSTCRRGSAG